jgi:Sec7-like guanine-nucleotide exchange factor
MATILCKGSDEFSKTCLRKYMRGFSYFVDSIDMAIRKMLMEVELPKETQQIDRLLQGFADRYCECNPGIFVSVDEAYFVAFSILLLHSDTHNKNNKRKMQKQDYVKNTQDQVEVSNDILECFHDNISYTPFIHFEDEVAINSHRLTVPKPRKSLFRTPSTESLRGPVDPYTLILDSKLDPRAGCG